MTLLWCILSAASSPRVAQINMFDRLRVLHGRGFKPSNVLDIGANRGEWTLAARKVFPSARFFMVEANPKFRAKLERSGVPFAIAVLDATTRNASMHLATAKRGDTGSSLFLETTNQQLFTPTWVTTSTLDDLLAANGRGGITHELLKIDVQGAELMLLRGGRHTLKGVEAILLELAVAQYNEGAPLWLSVQKELGRLNYQIYDVLELHYDPASRMLIQVDILFVSTASFLWDASATGYPRPLTW